MKGGKHTGAGNNTPAPDSRYMHISQQESILS